MNDFICPHCHAYLNVCNYITFSAEKEDGTKGLILLHPELGNFDSDHHSRFPTEEGEMITFRCPACHISLTSGKSNKLACIQAVDNDEKKFDIYFSRIKGEKSTYKVEGETVELYGDHTDNYINYFNLSQVK